MTKKYPTPAKPTSFLGTALGAAMFGAIVGGTGAAAKGIRAIKAGEATKEAVALDVAREAGSTAVAAGTATAVIGALGFGPLLAPFGIVAVATGTKYAMDALLKPNGPEPATVTVAASVPTVKKAAPAKKAAKKPTAKKAPAKKAKTAKTAAKKVTPSKATAKKATAKKTAAKKTTASKKAATKKTKTPKTGTKTDKA